MVRPRCLARLAGLIPLLSTARLAESNETTETRGPPGAQCAGTDRECGVEDQLGTPQFDAVGRPADDEEEEEYEEEEPSSSEDDDEGEEGEEGPSPGPSNATRKHISTTGSDLFGSLKGNGDPRKSRTFFELWANLGCNEVFETERPIPTKDFFSAAIDLYNSIQENPKLRINNKDAGGILVELEARQAGTKGRGIFALEDIPNGARWRSSYDYTAVFYQPKKYRSFLLGLERDMACDVMQWAYAEWVRLAFLFACRLSSRHCNASVSDLTICTRKDTVTDEAYIGVDLDEATLCNEGGEDGEDAVNVGCDEEDPDMDCMVYHYALRNIKKGEEILCDYGWHSGSAWGKTMWKWRLDDAIAAERAQTKKEKAQAVGARR